MCRRDHGWLSELLAAHEAEKQSLRRRIDALRAELVDARAASGGDPDAQTGSADTAQAAPGRRCDRPLARRA